MGFFGGSKRRLLNSEAHSWRDFWMRAFHCRKIVRRVLRVQWLTSNQTSRTIGVPPLLCSWNFAQPFPAPLPPLPPSWPGKLDGSISEPGGGGTELPPARHSVLHHVWPYRIKAKVWRNHHCNRGHALGQVCLRPIELDETPW